MKKIFTAAIAITFLCNNLDAQNWSLSGNTGTTTSNFIGTTDTKSLFFRVNNYRSGFIDYNTATANLAFGYGALRLNSTGKLGAAFGAQALTNNLSGYANTGIGMKSLFTNTTGSYNVALGARTLQASNGSFNTAAGYASLYVNNSGEKNAAYGYKTLFNNTLGNENTAVGYSALYSNTTGERNTAIGDSALFSNTYGYKNTAIGSQSLQYNTTGIYNTATGYDALIQNISGEGNTATGTAAIYLNTTGNYNTATGFRALYANISGTSNAAYGSDALSNATGSYNSGYGSAAGLYNSTGSYNCFFGYAALKFNSGSNNTGVGANTSTSVSNISNTTVIGADAVGTASNQVRIGNSTVTSIGGFADWTNVSDSRFKKNIKENIPGLSFINKLRPVSYNLDNQKIKTFLGSENEDAASATAMEKIVHTGFIAQEVEKVAKDLGYDFDGVDAPKNDKDYYGLRYSEFVVPLVKAVQELSTENEKLKTENDEMKSEMRNLKLEMDKIKKSLSSQSPDTGYQSSAINHLQASVIPRSGGAGASLLQNQPNPFSQNTIIKYFIPQQTNNAIIKITNANGVEIKSITLTQKGNGQIKIDAGSLAAGTYFYSLLIEGKKADTKQIQVLK